MTAETAFSALAVPMSLAWERGCPSVDDPVLPKSAERDNLSLGKAVIRWLSGETSLMTLPPGKILDRHNAFTMR
jgi:hypothetical protein